MTTTPATQAVTPEDKWQAAWDALPDGMHAYARARQAGINALGQAHSLPGDVGMRKALAAIVARKPRPEFGDGEACHRCVHCAYRWPDSGDERHGPDCAYVLALAALTPSAPEHVQELHELPPGEHICRHCEGNDPHCSVCEGVGSLPSHKGAGDADV